MNTIWRDVANGLDILPRQHSFQVVIRTGDTKTASKVAGLGQLHIAHRHHFHSLDPAKVLGVLTSHTASANYR